ncbi:hypothetical protein [Faecalibacter rhinopitheci]|uniref:Uncharacterized protein n=1 Tax=Faecalibacter rhinopitheci TaxID=2779678 RepID=A0A8J7FRN1_9FLAO|nr:hypothetical protein [Faecalibacter rhinopitheci]MBF0597298.1 hypothetical protein [Faecalibacter rhinopitheci]
MKNIISVLLITAFSTLNAQDKVSDYAYIVIPKNFENFENNQYKLRNHLNFHLKQKNYKIISDNPDAWPAEVKQNPCLALTTNVKKVKSFTNNRLEVEFTSCKNKIVESVEGLSKIKEYEPGYQEAIEIAIRTLPLSNPIKIENPILSSTPTETVPINTQNSVNTKVNVLSNETIYSDGTAQITLSKLANGDILLIQGTSIIAQFNPSVKTNIYHATIFASNGEKYTSIGYTTKDAISFEFLDQNKQWKERIFNKVK